MVDVNTEEFSTPLSSSTTLTPNTVNINHRQYITHQRYSSIQTDSFYTSILSTSF